MLLHASSKVIALSNQQPGVKQDPEIDSPTVGIDALTELLNLWASEKKGEEPLRVSFVGMVNVCDFFSEV